MCHLTSSSTKKTSNSIRAFVAFDFQWFNYQFISSSVLLQAFVMRLYVFVSKNRRSLKHSGRVNTWPVGKKQLSFFQEWKISHLSFASEMDFSTQLPLLSSGGGGGVNFSIFFSEHLQYWGMKVGLLFWLMCDVLIEDNSGYSRGKEAALLIVWGANCQDGLLTVHSFPITLHLLRTPSTKFFDFWFPTLLFVSLLPGQTVLALQSLTYFPKNTCWSTILSLRIKMVPHFQLRESVQASD